MDQAKKNIIIQKHSKVSEYWVPVASTSVAMWGRWISVLTVGAVVKRVLGTAQRMYMLCQLTEVVLLEVYAATFVLLWTLLVLRFVDSVDSDSTAPPPLLEAYRVAAAAA